MKTKSLRRRRAAVATPRHLPGPQTPSVYSWTGDSIDQGVDRYLELASGGDRAITAKLFLPPSAIPVLIAHLQRTLPLGSETVSDRDRIRNFRSVLAQVERAMNAPHQEGTPAHYATRGLFDLMRTVAAGLIKE